MSRHVKITRRQLERLRDQGLTMSEAAQELGVHLNTISEHALRMDFVWSKYGRRRSGPEGFSMDRALELRAEGLTLAQAADVLGVNSRTLGKWMWRKGEPWRLRRRPWRTAGAPPTRVHARLDELGLTQEEAAAQIGCQSSSVSALAAGRRVLLTDGRTFSGPAKRLAEVLGLPPEWLWADLQEQFGSNPLEVPSGLLLDVVDTSELEARVHEAQVRQRLHGALHEACTPRQRYILEQRYGLDDGEEAPIVEIGRTLDLSRTRVDQIHHEAKRWLKRALEDLLCVDGPTEVVATQACQRGCVHAALEELVEVSDRSVEALAELGRHGGAMAPCLMSVFQKHSLIRCVTSPQGQRYETTPLGKAVIEEHWRKHWLAWRREQMQHAPALPSDLAGGGR